MYAPTFRAEVEEKDRFYNSLREEIARVAADDTVVVLGDFNARVGVRDEAWPREVGVHGIKERNDSGDRVLATYAEFRLLVAIRA